MCQPNILQCFTFLPRFTSKTLLFICSESTDCSKLAPNWISPRVFGYLRVSVATSAVIVHPRLITLDEASKLCEWSLI